jgi:UV DNA damage endonuclease
MSCRLGYACISMTLRSKDICVNRTCRLQTAINQGVMSGYPKGSPEYSLAIYNFLSEYGIKNLRSMYITIDWSRKNNIYFYRISSDIFPHINNHRIQEHMLPEHWNNYSNLMFGWKIIYNIGAYAQKHQIRLTMHPGHYNQLGSNNQDVVENTFRDLRRHALLLHFLSEGAKIYKQNNQENIQDQNYNNIIDHSILCIHGGGTYGDKKMSLERWKQNYLLLPDFVKKRIALENDERCYSAEDLLPVCHELGIPLIFDFHHYNCWKSYHPENPLQKPIDILLPDILKTWERRNIRPKFHLSDQAKNKKIGAHHDYVQEIPSELLILIKTKAIDIMIEAKQKELATLYLKRKYNL